MANGADAAQAIGQVQSFLETSAQLGSLMFPVGAPVVSAITAVATILSLVKPDGMAATPDPVLVEIQESIDRVSTQLDELDQKIDQNFNNLMSLIVETAFLTEITDNVKILETHMKHVMKFKTDEAITNFMESVKKHNPVELVIKTTEKLRRDNTNPIIQAIERNLYRSQEAFDTWVHAIKNSLSTLILAHAFNQGLQGKKPAIGPMHDVVEKANRTLNEFIDEYELKINYWPSEVEKLMQETADNNQGSTHAAKAEIIRNALAGIYTKYQFYVIVYTHCTGNHQHAYLGDNLVTQFGRGGVNIAVIRSRSASTASKAEMKEIETGLEEARRNKQINDIGCKVEGFRKSLTEIMPTIKRSGVMVAIMASQAVRVRWTGKHELGPGWLIKDTPILYSECAKKFGRLFEIDTIDYFAFVLVSMQ